MLEDDGLIDFTAYGLTTADVRSCAAMASVWIKAAYPLWGRSEFAEDQELQKLLFALPASLGDPQWQRGWMRCWDRLVDGGVAVGAIFTLLFSVANECEREILGDLNAVRPLHLDLCLIVRRGLVAAGCGAMEGRELLKNSRAGVAGEVTATHTLHAWAVSNRRAAVLSLSLQSRDTRAHFSGDDLQQLPSLILERLQAFLRPQDLVFTGRENEWLILLPDVASKVQPSLLGAHIERAFVEPMRLASGCPISMVVRIGAALLPEHGRQANVAIQAARLARWSIADDGERFAWFQSGQAQDWAEYARLVDELRTAIERSSLELYLQPQVDLESGLCIGAELLLRWRRSNGESVPPPRVIELVEQNGWQQLFTDWLIRTAMGISADLHAAGVRVTLSLNLTAGDLADPELPDLLAQRLEAWDIPGKRFQLELTESAMMGDKAHVLSVIARLRALGFEMSLDDFGTGYSSLSYLVSLPIHELKVDRSFVVAMFDSDENMRIVRTIIDLAIDLGMVPLAEGIDDERQLVPLRAMGCRVGQGYLFSEPLPMPRFVEWYRAQRRSAAGP